MHALFESDGANRTLSRFKVKLEGIAVSNEFEVSRNRLIKLVVTAMIENPDAWDKQCQINIEWIGSQFINKLTDIDKEYEKEELDDICSMTFRFLLEYYLSMKNELSREFEVSRVFVIDNIDSFDDHAKLTIQYALAEMPIAIIKNLLNNDSLESIKEFNITKNAADKLKQDWDTELNRKERKVNKLQNALEKYETAFNFVGLHQGFDELSKDKKAELASLVFWLRFLSIIIVAPVLIELFIIYTNIKDITAIKDALLVSIFPTLSFVAISIYYFRVVLFNYKSVKSHLLQIELRKTLCKFIQSYADYSKEIKENDSNSLEKFENMIFSGIVNDEVGMPSTYDGIEQISKLIKSVKS